MPGDARPVHHRVALESGQRLAQTVWGSCRAAWRLSPVFPWTFPTTTDRFCIGARPMTCFQGSMMATLKAFLPGVHKWIDRLSLGDFKPYYCTGHGAAFHLDSMSVLKVLPSASIDLVLTSPPFALTRQKEYGNEPVERYLDWFMPFCLEIKRVLKPT